eukprot:359368-Chlamydomonas_euryale.AAC.1
MPTRSPTVVLYAWSSYLHTCAARQRAPGMVMKKRGYRFMSTFVLTHSATHTPQDPNPSTPCNAALHPAYICGQDADASAGAVAGVRIRSVKHARAHTHTNWWVNVHLFPSQAPTQTAATKRLHHAALPVPPPPPPHTQNALCRHTARVCTARRTHALQHTCTQHPRPRVHTPDTHRRCQELLQRVDVLRQQKCRRPAHKFDNFMWTAHHTAWVDILPH